MLNLTLIIFVVIAAYLQPTEDRRNIALIYAIPVAFFVLIYNTLGDNAVYFIAGVFSFATALYVSKITVEDKFRKNIVRLCLASIAINAFGFCIYHAGFEPVAYSVSLSVLYVAAFIVLMRGHGHARSLGANSDRLSVRSHAYQGVQHSDEHK